jgi:hypothetical protein
MTNGHKMPRPDSIGVLLPNYNLDLDGDLGVMARVRDLAALHHPGKITFQPRF